MKVAILILVCFVSLSVAVLNFGNTMLYASAKKPMPTEWSAYRASNLAISGSAVAAASGLLAYVSL